MQFGRYINKGLWAVADKLLPVVYGLVFVLLVVRVLPKEEFGNFVLVQDIFLTITGLATAFALQPLLKFFAEDASDSPSVVPAAILMYAGFVACVTILTMIFRAPVGRVLNSPSFPDLVILLSLMTLASIPRSISLTLLQAGLNIKEVFWVDAVHFLGAPVLIFVWSQMFAFQTAAELIRIIIATQASSSIVGVIITRRYWTFAGGVTRNGMRKVWQYGGYTLASTVGALAGIRADTFLLSAYGGLEQLALYNSAKIFLRLYDMVSQVIQMLIVPATSKISSRGDKRSLLALIEKALLFGTILILPVFFSYALLAEPAIRILYQGRYLEAIPILRILSLPALIVPAMAIAGTTLLGLGKARLSFWLGISTAIMNLCAYALLIPWLGASGAAWGATISAYVIGGMALWILRKEVPFTIAGVLSRYNDITVFLRERLGGHEQDD
jgi:O-antigen/teichoic acid export membrane protein